MLVDAVSPVDAWVTVTTSVYAKPDWQSASATGSVIPATVSTTHGIPLAMPHPSGDVGATVTVELAESAFADDQL